MADFGMSALNAETGKADVSLETIGCETNIYLMEEEMPTPPVDPWEHLEGWDRTLAQMMHIYIEPEVVRRQADKLIPRPYELYAAQVLFPVTDPPYVLLNEELSGSGLIRLQRDVNKGDPIMMSDFAHLQRYELPDDLLDCGHFTIFRASERWGLFFNFLSGRAKAQDMLHLASQFLQAAEEAAVRGHQGPAVDNMFSACELTSKAELILLRQLGADGGNHKAVHSRINVWGRTGNVDAAFVALFNRVSRERPLARYGNQEHRPSAPSKDDFDLVKTVIENANRRVRRATDESVKQELSGSVSPPVLDDQQA